MGVFDDFIKIDENGVVSYVGWVEWKHFSTGVLHCPVCLVLDKCWFSNILKPKLPQHEKCHCTINNISKPIPNINTKAKGENMKYLDLVELIKEKPTYSKAGVKVGDFGAIMSEKPIEGKWQVAFSEFYTGKDIADIMVDADDLKIHESVPKEKYPKKQSDSN